MSDEFRSLFDDDEPEEKKDQPPDDTPEWLRDVPVPGDKPQRPDSLGFTGELQWRKDLGDPFADLDAEQGEESFDWQADQPASTEGGQSSGFGLTGQLSWQQGGESEEALPEPGDDDLLDWMQPHDSAAEETEDDDGWVQPSAPPEPRPSAGDYNLPPWLMGADNEQDQGMFLDATGQLSEAWLHSGDQLPETHESDITYDEWMAQKEAAQRPRDIEEEVPDLPVDAAPGGEVQGAGEVPDWFLGMEKLDTSDAPDWFQDAPATPSAPAPDLIGEFDLEQSIAAPDWLTTPLEDDLLGEMALEESIGEPPETPAEDDLLPEFNLEQAMADWTPEEALPDEPSAESGEMPDWLSAMQPSTAEADELPDWMGTAGSDELALEDSMTGDASDWLSGGDDLLAELDLEQSIADTSDRKDWFGDAEKAEPAQPEWLQQLGETSSAETIIPGDADFLAELQGVVDTGALPDLDAPAFQDIDSLLASMDTGEFDLPKTGELLLDPNPEIDEMFAREIMAEPEPGAPDVALAPDVPDWLTELGATVGKVSAAAIVRQRKDRPLEDLDTRLQNLHERGEELAVPELDDAEEQNTLAALLPGVPQVLSPTRSRPGLPGLTQDVVLSDAQRDQVKLLKTLVAAEDDVQRASAIDRTYDSPYMEGLLDEEEAEAPVVEEAPAPAPRPRQRRRRLNLGRFVISLIVAAGVILPYYVTPLRLGDLPPASFAAGSSQQAAFALVDSLTEADLVLVAVEYGPTGAAELDSLTDALLRHIFTQGARPVLVSGNPVGLLHANNVLDAINADSFFFGRINRSQPFTTNQDYYVVRYLAGNVVGLRGFSQNAAAYLTTDIREQATDLTVNGLSDFSLLVVISERAEDVRNWSEQIVPLANAPVVYATGFSAAPLAAPYAPGGLLVGYRDAYTYNVLLDPSLAPPAAPTTAPTEVTPEIVPTATLVPPTDVPPTDAPTVSEEAIAPAEVSPTEAPVEPTAVPTEAPVEPTATLEPAATNTLPPPTSTPVPPTATELPVITGVVDAQQTINVRAGPSTENAVVTTLEPGTEVRVLGRNSDGSWINIQLEDGTEGWVAEELLDIQEPGASADKPSILARVLAQDATPTQEGAQVSMTEEAIAEATVEVIPTVSSIQSAAVAGTPYRDERWYSMTLGIVVIVVVIALGSIVNVLRSLFGRRPR